MSEVISRRKATNRHHYGQLKLQRQHHLAHTSSRDVLAFLLSRYFGGNIVTAIIKLSMVANVLDYLLILCGISSHTTSGIPSDFIVRTSVCHLSSDAFWHGFAHQYDVLSGISSDILFDISLTFFLTHLSDILVYLMAYLQTFLLASFPTFLFTH